MSASVVGLRGEPIQSNRREQFLAQVAESFDLYVKDYGEEPECLVYVMGGITQTCRAAWFTSGISEAGAMTMKAASMAVLMKELTNPDA